MNIIVSTHDPLQPVTGGGALRTLKTAEEFRKRGHSVLLIGPTDGTAAIGGINVEWLRGPSKQRSQLLSSLKFNLRLLIKYLKFAKWADMIFVHNTIAAAALLLLRPFFRFKLALDITDIHAEYIVVGKRTFMERILTPLLLALEYRIIKLADSITVASYAMKDVLVAHGISGNLVEIVYDGAETDKIPFEKTEDCFNVIHLGLVDKQHGVDLLIRALPDVLALFPHLKCIIVGDGRELVNIKSLAHDLGVDAHCVFTGQLPCEKAREYLKSATAGIIPRRDNLPNRIVTTLKLLEYWASGTCVISSRLAAIEEIGKEGEDIAFFEEGNPAALAVAIKTLLSSPEAVESMRRNGLSAARRYSWDVLIPHIADHALKEI